MRKMQTRKMLGRAHFSLDFSMPRFGFGFVAAARELGTGGAPP